MALSDSLKSTDCTVKSACPLVRALMDDALIEMGSIEQGPSALFISAHCACICVEGPEIGNEPRYRL